MPLSAKPSLSVRWAFSFLILVVALGVSPSLCNGHGTVIYPISRAYRIYQANPSNPSFALAANAVAIDGALPYYTWNEVSRNIPQAVAAGLPPGFDYSPWVPDGEIASGGRTDPNSTAYPRTYAGLDQVSADWPKTEVNAGEVITLDFLATAIHIPSVWDVWMTKPTWDPSMPLTWAEMEFLERPTPTLINSHFTFDLTVPSDRSGHHVIWVVYQRNDPIGEAFFSTSDIEIRNYPGSKEDFEMSTAVNGAPLTSSPDVKYTTFGDTIDVHFESPGGTYNNTIPVLLATIYATGTLPPSPFGFPEVFVDPNNVIVAFDGQYTPLGLTLMPPGGLTFSYATYPGFAGFSVIFQGFALAGSTNTGNVITATDGYEFRVN